MAEVKVPLPPIPLPDHAVALAAEFADGTRTPAEPRNAATVVLLRESPVGEPGGPEIYLLRRQVSMDFAGGFCVFPGGGVDPRDFDTDIDAAQWAGPDLATWAARLDVTEDEARALVCAAVRETFEESGVLLAGPAEGSVVDDTTGDDWEADRQALEARELAMTDFLARRGLVLRTDLLVPWDAWLTPAFEPKRYRTWFFAAALPAGQITRDVSGESDAVTWLAAGAAAAQAEQAHILMLPPTYLTCLDVADHGSVDAVLAAGAQRSVRMFCPDVETAEFDGEPGHTLSMPDRSRELIRLRHG